MGYDLTRVGEVKFLEFPKISRGDLRAVKPLDILKLLVETCGVLGGASEMNHEVAYPWI